MAGGLFHISLQLQPLSSTSYTLGCCRSHSLGVGLPRLSPVIRGISRARISSMSTFDMVAHITTDLGVQRPWVGPCALHVPADLAPWLLPPPPSPARYHLPLVPTLTTRCPH